MEVDGSQERRRQLLRRGQWRTEVEVRRRELYHRLEVAEQPLAPEWPEEPRALLSETVEAVAGDMRVTVQVEQSAAAADRRPPHDTGRHRQAVLQALADAQDAIDSTPALRAWWTGTAVTMAWESVHDAEGELLEIESDELVRASLPRLRAWLREVVPDKELLGRYDRLLLEFMDGTKPLDRSVVRQAHQVAMLANNDRHAGLRTFRNLLISATLVLAALLIVAAAWHAITPDFVSLCATDAARTCLSGATASPRDLAEIELVGAIGGLLSVAFALGSSGAGRSRYNVRAPQAALKPVAGAATALIGVLLVQSHILIAPAERVSESLLLAYAALFGFSQQLLTRFVDKRAGKLLEGEAETKQT